MAEILGLGLTHYPPLCGLDKDMANILAWTLGDPDIPPELKDPANWPADMRREWGEDRGEDAAAEHRAALVANLDRLRAILDDFAPDVVVIWGDDQYENFKEDIIPPFAVCAYDDLEVKPWKDSQTSAAMDERKNFWGEDAETGFTLRGRRDIAKELATGLLEAGIDVAYAYRPLHHRSIAHAFLNTILYLDYHRKGFDYPVIAFPLNCYGRRVVSCKGFLTRLGDEIDFDPPSPPPWRFMEMGAATARVLRRSPWRVALIASSSWSHAFLCDKTYRLRPDTASDRRLYEALSGGDFEAWRDTSLAQLEDAGEHEMLNWFALLGAMEELGAELDWAQWVGTDVFNSNKVFAAYRPAG
jgi:hypothetical protein